MRQFVIISVLIMVAATKISAQTYLQHLQEKKQEQGQVTVTQDKSIDELVNGNNTQNTTAPKTETPKNKTQNNHSTIPADNIKKTQIEKKIKENEPDTTKTDTHKKVMRRSYKIDGYRVQVFAGGNSRDDKIKAQQAGNKVKQAIPEQPVYVHFYSPRWICRIGNFRSFEEANDVLRQIQKLGYKEACIVSGKITVSY